MPLHDQSRSYSEEIGQMQQAKKTEIPCDAIALITGFKAVMIEGTEVIFIVIALGTAEKSFFPAGVGAAAALLLVVLLASRCIGP